MEEREKVQLLSFLYPLFLHLEINRGFNFAEPPYWVGLRDGVFDPPYTLVPSILVSGGGVVGFKLIADRERLCRMSQRIGRGFFEPDKLTTTDITATIVLMGVGGAGVLGRKKLGVGLYGGAVEYSGDWVILRRWMEREDPEDRKNLIVIMAPPCEIEPSTLLLREYDYLRIHMAILTAVRKEVYCW